MFEYKQIFKEQAIYPDLDLKDGSGRYEIVIKICKSDFGLFHMMSASFVCFVPLLLFSDCLEKKKILIQGIEVPMSTPILWLSEHFSYPDNFLHIAVTDRDNGEE